MGNEEESAYLFQVYVCMHNEVTLFVMNKINERLILMCLGVALYAEHLVVSGQRQKMQRASVHRTREQLLA